MTSQWYVGRTGPRAERIAERNLQRRGARCYLPTVVVPNAAEGAPKRTPLFPGYLFLYWDLESQGLAPIQHVEGFRGFVRFDDAVPALPKGAVDEVQAVEDAINGRGGLTQTIHAGQQVRVSFAKTDTLGQALQSARSARDRIWVLMKWFGRTVRAKVSAGDLVPLPPSDPLPWRERIEVRGNASDPSLLTHHPSPGPQGRPPRRTRGRGRYIKAVHPSAPSDPLPWRERTCPERSRRIESLPRSGSGVRGTPSDPLPLRERIEVRGNSLRSSENNERDLS